MPILVLSVRQSEAEKVAALDAGANDYVVKPFGIEELLARVRALLRRGGSPASRDAVGDRRRRAHRSTSRAMRSASRATLVKLTRKEFDLLRVLAQNAGRILTHGQILREVWGKAHEHDTQYLRVFVSQLRHKLRDDPADPRFILNEPGVGYRMLEPPEQRRWLRLFGTRPQGRCDDFNERLRRNCQAACSARNTPS